MEETFNVSYDREIARTKLRLFGAEFADIAPKEALPAPSASIAFAFPQLSSRNVKLLVERSFKRTPPCGPDRSSPLRF